MSYSSKSFSEFNSYLKRYFTCSEYREQYEYIAGALKAPLCTSMLTGTMNTCSFLWVLSFLLRKESTSPRRSRPAETTGQTSQTIRRPTDGQPDVVKKKRACERRTSWDREHVPNDQPTVENSTRGRPAERWDQKTWTLGPEATNRVAQPDNRSDWKRPLPGVPRPARRWSKKRPSP